MPTSQISASQKMYCIEITKPGSADVLQLIERPIPQPGPNEVLIKVAAAGINRPDVFQRQGLYPPPEGASNIPGLEALETADAAVFYTRFQNLPDEQMKHIDAYLNRGGPVMGLRTATHGFKIPADATYAKYDFRSKVEGYENGFGHQVLGQTWVGHYGRNHKQSTRITIVPEKAGHPILTGVKDIHVQCGGYNAETADDFNILTMAQPLMSMEFDGEPDESKPPKASEWTREYAGAKGEKGRVFTSLYGASEDILNDGYRRMLINGVYWIAGLEDKITADSPIGFVGPYEPNTFRGGGYARGVKPSMYEGFESRIPANANTSEKK